MIATLENSLRDAATAVYLWPGLDIEAAALNIFALVESVSLREYDHISDVRLIDALTDMIYRTLFRELWA